MNDDNEEKVKITLEVPKVLRLKIRMAAAQNDRLVSEEVRDALARAYGGVEIACGEV